MRGGLRLSLRRWGSGSLAGWVGLRVVVVVVRAKGAGQPGRDVADMLLTMSEQHQRGGAMTPGQGVSPGDRVRVIQQVPRQEFGGGSLATVIEGTVVRWEQAKTGSWYAHARDDKLWLDRLVLRRDDGETVYLNLDQYSLVERLG